MKKLMRMFTTDEKYKLQMFLEQVNQDDKAKAEAYENRSTYVNPSSLRLEYYAKGKAFYRAQYRDYSPV